MSVPVGVVMRRGAELAAARLGGESVSREARRVVATTHHALRPRTCTYCPNRALHGRITCHGHSDLIAIDPFFSPDVPQNSKPAERSLTEALLDGLNRKGA